MSSDGGKGSSRRKENAQAVRDNWDLIFGRKSAGKKDQPMNEHDDDDECFDEGEWQCDVCGGPMYRQAHWSYAQCDDCGARQELEDDI